MQYDAHIVEGHWNEMMGELAGARSCFQAASQLRPEESAPVYQLGKVCVYEGNIVGAEQAFNHYIAMQPDDLSGYIELATLYERQKDYAKIVDTYDQIYTMRPDLVADKGMKKIYKKACKKSGNQGRFL